MPQPSPITVAFLLFPKVTQLDFTGPAQVLTRMGNTEVKLVAASRDPVSTDCGFAIHPTHTLDEVHEATILCVPGGFGVTDALEDAHMLAWVRGIAGNAEWVTAVCTGALLLGAAGLLKGYRATTHWGSHHLLAAFGAIPVHERVVFDRNRVTGGGVTAGIDFGLALAAAIRGEDHARFIQLSLEYDPQPPFDSGAPAKASAEVLERYHALVKRHAADRDARTLAAAERQAEDD
jgi:cyclohexyl-isocyanide hydratase